MKKILILLVIICFCGCMKNTPQETVIKENIYKLSETTTIQYIEFDGHQFIEYRCGGVHGGGSLCHSPNCPCLEQYKRK